MTDIDPELRASMAGWIADCSREELDQLVVALDAEWARRHDTAPLAVDVLDTMSEEQLRARYEGVKS